MSCLRGVSPARRVAATAALAAQKDGAVYAATALAAAAGELSAADLALAREILAGAIRHRRSLNAILFRFLAAGKEAGESSKSGKRRRARYDGKLLELLRQGAYQLIFLSRVPVHAVVNDTVSLTQDFLAGRSAGLVNAVLRRVSEFVCIRGEAAEPPPQERRRALFWRQGAWALLAAPFLPDPEPQRVPWLGLTYSYPDALVREWLNRWGEAQCRRILAAGNAVPAICARLNPLRQGLARPEEILAGAANLRPGPEEGTYLFEPVGEVGEMPGFAAGLFTVQDASAVRAARLLEAQPGEEVLELCAAPGTKTTAIAEMMEDRGLVVALDADPGRLKLVEQNAARLGLRSIRPLLADGTAPPPELQGRFNRVLVDAPCSNLGVLPRRWEARWRAEARTLKRLAELQWRLLAGGARGVKPGGLLQYVTCTLSVRENEEVTQKFLDAHEEFALLSQETVLPEGGVHDGGYVARFRRR